MNELECTRLVRERAVAWDPSLHSILDAMPCERCGQFRRGLQRHHRQFRSRGGVWVPSNVVLICHLCHDDCTNEAPWVKGAGFNVHTWEEPTEVAISLWYTDEPVLLDDLGGYSLAG